MEEKDQSESSQSMPPADSQPSALPDAPKIDTSSGEPIAASDRSIGVSVEKKSFFKSRVGHILLGFFALALVIGGGYVAFLGGGEGDANDSPRLDFEDFSNESTNQEEVDSSGPNYAAEYSLIDEDTGTQVTVTIGGDERTITANGLPNHTTGEFPNESNPNTISAQSYTHVLPLNPKKNTTPTTYNVETTFGIAINGVLFDRYAAEYFKNNPNSGWQLAGIINDLGFDFNNAHVQPDGTYHYHGNPTSLITDFEPQLLGFAADGFPIYSQFSYSKANDTNSTIVRLKPSYKLQTGSRPDGPRGIYDGTYEEDWVYKADHGDLDQCNGREGVTKEFPNGTYYYVITDDFPFVPTCFWGDVVDSFKRAPVNDNNQQDGGGLEELPPPKPIDELVPPPGFDI